MPRAKEHAGQGYNEWLNVHISYKKSLHKSKYDSGYQHDQNCGNRADLCPLHHQPAQQAMATKEPTLISMPPVIITVVMPTPITIRPALEIKQV